MKTNGKYLFSGGNEIVYLDLFSGTGGFAKGLLDAGFTFKRHYFSEIDKYAVANYQYNFNHAKNIGDITQVKEKKIERPNLVTFGSPCQDLSFAGRFKGLKGQQSSLFFEAVAIIDKYRPEVFVFENVKGIFASNKGKDFEIILQAIANLGLYHLQWQLLNSCWFLPQSRERIYAVGFLRGKAAPQVFPLKEGSCLSEAGEEAQEVRKDIATAITKTYSKGVHGRGETYISTANKLRRLTPLECERLQGFPDGWTQYGKFNGRILPISDVRRYKMLGEAVTVPVVKAIGERLLGKEMLPVEIPQNKTRLLTLELELELFNHKLAA